MMGEGDEDGDTKDNNNSNKETVIQLEGIFSGVNEAIMDEAQLRLNFTRKALKKKNTKRMEDEMDDVIQNIN